MKSDIEIGSYLQNLRKERKMSLREVADHVGIDISMLSKIEHGERQLQSHMIAPIADLFEIDYKSIQIQFINQKILQEFGDEPYLNEALQILATTNK
ncbi:MAG: helix-turn-helix domain-containing protein [Bacteroidota bacterium]|jgi:transcriptional regulator with XRE-family HTH domain